ncbi:MAG: DNA adenine methylase [Shewanella sp.]
MKSFLKWPGGKGRVLAELLKILPEGDCLVEPFVGSGTVFLNTNYPRYILADINEDLINTMEVVRDRPEVILTTLLFMFGNVKADYYYQTRDMFNQRKTCADKDQNYKLAQATAFIFLNRHGFNGLVRYNQDGTFNVPYGHYNRAYKPRDEIIGFSKKAKDAKAEFLVQDFVTTIEQAPDGSVIYADPPYIPLSETSAFSSYHTAPFGKEQHIKLAAVLRAAKARGCKVVLSNSDTELTREIYHDFKWKEITVRRSIGAGAETRVKVKELIGVL